jgi:hypothetical protein
MTELDLEALSDRLGQIADNLDSALFPQKLPGLPASLHLEGLSGSVRQCRDELAAIVRELSGEDPWADNPLEG